MLRFLLSRYFSNKYGFCFLVTCALLSASAQAQEVQLAGLSHDSLWSLSLEQLTQVEVRTASKRGEERDQAPAVVTSISQSEIRRYGARNLQDVLRRVAGVSPMSSVVLRDNVMSIRGQQSKAIDRRVLLLLNGRPVRDGNTGGSNSHFYRSFPVSAIKTIELIRGPGSVLYGSNAFSGVINVMTVEAEDSPSELKVTLGSFGTYAVEGVTSAELTESASVVAAGKRSVSAGWDYRAFDFVGVEQQIDYESDDYSVTLNGQWRNFEVSYYESRTKDAVMDSSPAFPRWPATEYYKLHRFVDVGYLHPLNDSWSLQANFTYNRQNREVYNGAVDVDGENTLTELVLLGDLNENTHLIAGLNYQDFDGVDFNGTPDPTHFRFNWKAAYVQLDHRLADWAKVVLGSQYNDDSTEQQLSSRAGLILNWSERWGAKILWAEAFRSPYAAELFLASPSLKGNPDLSPENIETLDLQLTYHAKKARIELNYFESKVTNTLDIDRTNFPLTFFNTVDVDFHGYEFVWAWQPSEHWELQGSWSYQTNETADGVVNGQIVANHMAKMGVYHQFSPGIRLGVFDSYFSKPADWSAINPQLPTALAAPKNLNEAPKDYHHLTLNLSVNLGQSFDNPALQTITLELYGDNLLESSPVYHPDLTGNRVNSFPFWPERSWHISLTSVF